MFYIGNVTWVRVLGAFDFVETRMSRLPLAIIDGVGSNNCATLTPTDSKKRVTFDANGRSHCPCVFSVFANFSHLT